MHEIRIDLPKRVNQELLDEEIKAVLPKAVGSSMFGGATLVIYVNSEKLPAGAGADVARVIAAHNADGLSAAQQQAADDKAVLAEPYPADGEPDTLARIRRRLRALERACKRAGIIE